MPPSFLKQKTWNFEVSFFRQYRVFRQYKVFRVSLYTLRNNSYSPSYSLSTRLRIERDWCRLRKSNLFPTDQIDRPALFPLTLTLIISTFYPIMVNKWMLETSQSNGPFVKFLLYFIQLALKKFNSWLLQKLTHCVIFSNGKTIKKEEKLGALETKLVTQVEKWQIHHGSSFVLDFNTILAPKFFRTS